MIFQTRTNAEHQDIIRKAEIERREKKEKLEKERKEQKEKEQKEQKEKEQKEQKEKEQKEKEQYRYQHVFHICDIKNLESIIEKGLFCRLLAEMKCPGFVSIANMEIVGNRRSGKNDRPNLTTFASTYFEPINAMYYAVRRKYKIVIVEFELDLSKPGIVITDGNAATGGTVSTNFHDSNFVEIMSKIQLETIDAEYKGKDQWTGESTDPDYREHIRIKQAECLVPDNTSRDCIKSIQLTDTTNDRDTISHVVDLIAKSGLSIKVKIMNLLPPSVIRE